ncbi:uncharacterized protein LOC112690074 [Sipha flava]|jgi:hypothetical protein|uniref:Uncharacterized protein LOC112690074 n=1 Tax=Sipha flava TaxID=143950 RepID=A0A8B8G981_9HEMI|nr:uncharacterized protein LOC112690074 [Sipha flava]
MPEHRCIVPACTSGYDSYVDKYHFFTVPKDDTRLAQWTKAIPRKDFIIKPKQVVCELHFREADIIRKKIMTDTSGKVLTEMNN